MKITELTKHFEKFSLHIQSLSFESGKIYGLIGPNGSGKTTALKLLAGLMKPDGGEIDYGGLAFRDITMVARKPYFLHDTVYHNFIYPLKLRKMKPDNTEIEHYLEIAGMCEQKNQYAPSLSSGEQQKLALIRAMIFSPKLILLDEPFSNLDMESAGRFEKLILERQKTNPATWVIISHQLAHIMRLCEGVCFINGGVVEEIGPTDKLLMNPESTELKKYLQFETLKEEGGNSYNGVFSGRQC